MALPHRFDTRSYASTDTVCPDSAENANGGRVRIATGWAVCYLSGVSSKHDYEARETRDVYFAEEVLSPFKRDAWLRLTPAERLARSWRLRSRLPDPQAVHDRKLLPKP